MGINIAKDKACPSTKMKEKIIIIIEASMLSKFIYRLLVVLTAISFSLNGMEHELLQMNDISKIMQQIFDQHVDKKEVSSSIIKSSFRVYIDQFDPDRVYLLESEAQPFLQMSDSQAAKIMEQYKHNDFTSYIDLNNIIQKAISRAQKIRSGLVKEDPLILFQDSSTIKVNAYDDWSDPDLKRSFAKDEGQLSENIKSHLLKFIAMERQRFGDAYVKTRAARAVKVFDQEARSHENAYLYVAVNGQPMNEAEQHNAFAMHVLKALANSLDAHTSVLSPAEAFELRLRLEKEIQGIGIELHAEKNGSFIIAKLIDGGPAAKSGLVNPKDQLVEIDGTTLKGKTIKDVMELLHGKDGSTVTLLLKRTVDENGIHTDKTITVPLVRGEIPVNDDRATSSYETYGNGIIGVIKLDSFYQGENGVSSETDVRQAIQKLDEKGNLRGLILDLRENSGGFLSQSVKVAGLFITNGVVVISKYYNGEEHFYRDIDGKRAYSGPLIILTSKATASAAEIVAQALQDYGVGIVVGDPHTYGKGSIQSQTVTDNQSSAFFKVTVGKYYTVSGKTPQIQGVKADIVVPSLFYNENIGEQYLDYPLKEDVIPASYDDSLQDVPANLKPWYIHYYTPTIQHKQMVWRSLLPKLKKNSEYRIAHNKNYDKFLKGASPKELQESASGQQVALVDTNDLQMAEAVNILKDMIILHSQMPGYGSDEETANNSSSP